MTANAFLADCMMSTLFLSLPERYTEIVPIFESEWVVFCGDHSVQVVLIGRENYLC